MNLSAIGVPPEAEEVYRYFLRHPREGVDSVRQVLTLDPDTIEVAVETLSRLSLIDISDRHRIVPTDPRVGIERLIEKRIDQLNSEIRLVLATRDLIAPFVECQHDGDDDSASNLDIERVEGVDRVRQRLDDLAFFSYREVLSLAPGGTISPGAIEAARPLDMRCLRRGLTMKSVYEEKALGDPVFAEYIRDTAHLGGHVHIATEPMDRMVIFDRSVAVVPIDPKRSKRGALLVREPGLVSQLVTYFEGVWQGTAELEAFIEPVSNGPQLSNLEMRVLAALATSDKDEVAARELDVSVRTYRRYVADLMARLGAVNRFQAALRAKEENWI